MVFGAEPPLFSKPANYVPPPPPPAHVQHNLGQTPAPGGGAPAAGGSYPSITPYASQQPPAGGPGQQQPPPGGGGYPSLQQSGSPSRAGGAGGASAAAAAGPPSAGDLEEAFAGLAVRALAGRLQAGLEAFNRDAAREMDSLLEVQRQLAAREQELQRAVRGRLGARVVLSGPGLGLAVWQGLSQRASPGCAPVSGSAPARPHHNPPPQVGSVQQERAGTEGIVAELGSKCRALEKWLEENEWKAAALAGAARGGGGGGRGGGGAALDADAAAEMLSQLDVNKLVVPADDLSRQALGAQAEDLAVEDALTVLDKALQGGKVAITEYIKQVGGLGWCRRGLGRDRKGVDGLWSRLRAAALRGPRSHPLSAPPSLTRRRRDCWSPRFPRPSRSRARCAASSSSRARAASKSRSCSTPPPRASRAAARPRAGRAMPWCRATAGGAPRPSRAAAGDVASPAFAPHCRSLFALPHLC
jgi:hypothetical protein